jgi:hypothetical protein
MKHKNSNKLTIILIISILIFMVLGQLKFVASNVSVMASGLCIVSLIVIVIKDIVMSNRAKKELDEEGYYKNK